MEDAVGIALTLGLAYLAFRYFFISSAPPRPIIIPQSTLDSITSMFPHIPSINVRYELQRNGGNAEGVVERCLREGRLPDAPTGFFPDSPPPPPVINPVSTTTTMMMGEGKKEGGLPKSLIVRLGLEGRLSEKGQEKEKEETGAGLGTKGGKKGWESITKERELALRERKAKRVLEARRLMMEKEAK